MNKIAQIIRVFISILSAIILVFHVFSILGVWPPDMISGEENIILSVKYKGQIVIWVVQKYNEQEFGYTTKFRYQDAQGKTKEEVLDIDDMKQSRNDYNIIYNNEIGELIILNKSKGIAYDYLNKEFHLFRAHCGYIYKQKKEERYQRIYFPQDVICSRSYGNIVIK